MADAEPKPTATEAPAPAPVEQPPAAEKVVAPAADSSPSTAAAAAAATAAPAAAVAATTAAEEPAAVSALAQLSAGVPALVAAAGGHSEMWGVELLSGGGGGGGEGAKTTTSGSVPAGIVLQKFLNANEGDAARAAEQLGAALKFRAEKKPVALLDKVFSKAKFAELGVVTWYDVEGGAKVPEVFTWNLYGNVKDRMDEVFVPLEEFMDYRIALQELGVQKLGLNSATEPISETSDPYKITQVHDYKGVSFLRQNPNVKAASTEVIKQFSIAYPELLKEKFFVNVPAIMGWLYALIKLIVAAKTAKKFHPMANGANLAAEFKGGKGAVDGKVLPKEYGGQAGGFEGGFEGLGPNVANLKFA